MTWTATVTDYYQGAGTYTITILYSDGVSQKFARTYPLPNSDASIESLVQSEVANFTALSDKSQITYKVGDSVKLP